MRPIDRRKSAAWTDVNVTGSGRREGEIHWKIADCRTRPHFPTEREEVSRSRDPRREDFIHSQFASVDVCTREGVSERIPDGREGGPTGIHSHSRCIDSLDAVRSSPRTAVGGRRTEGLGWLSHAAAVSGDHVGGWVGWPPFSEAARRREGGRNGGIERKGRGSSI